MRRSLVIGLLLFGLGGPLAACGDDTDGGREPDGAAVDDQGAVSPVQINPCTLVTPERLTAAFGVDFGTFRGVKTTNDDGSANCTWSNGGTPNGAISFTINLLVGDDLDATWEEGKDRLGEGITRLDIGDEAYADPAHDPSLIARKGDTLYLFLPSIEGNDPAAEHRALQEVATEIVER